MPDPRGGQGRLRPDFYIAAIGRSGSTLLCNWLTRAPNQLVFNEPFFCRPENSRLLRIQLANFGMPAAADEWEQQDETAERRFERLMAWRLAAKRWAFKEVLCEEHWRARALFDPPKVLITVRNIVDVALSFFEKHRAQGNLARFSDQWVADYCVQETAEIVRFQERLRADGVAHMVVRYEDFVASSEVRRSIERFLGWSGGGDTAAHMQDYGREFELVEHGTSISGTIRAPGQRGLAAKNLARAGEIGERCNAYQLHFGYGETSRHWAVST
jgi:hypothetical protein